jgi:phosphohistidine phosphatase
MESVDDVGRGASAGRALLKQLTLLRHAKSSWDERGLDDHDRPLSKRGLHDAPDMAQRLAAHGLAPQLLLTSTAARARHTAELAMPAFGGTPPRMQVESRIYLASPGELIAVIAEQDDAVSSLVLIGHNPGLTSLCSMLLPEMKLQNLPTAGAVSIKCEMPDWAGIDAAAFSLVFYDYPKNPQQRA